MDKRNVGIVGLGWVAGAHIEAFKAVTGADVTAICSRREHDEAVLADTYGTPLKAYTDYEEMLADPDIHIIDICTPHPFHAETGYRRRKSRETSHHRKTDLPHLRRCNRYPRCSENSRSQRLRLF